MINLDHIPFPDHSRIWIYQADKKLSADEKNYILNKGKEFTSTWAAHGNELTAQLFVELDHFIIIALDEQMEAASGCSIDKSMKLILDLQKELGMSLTNRLISALFINDEVVLMPYQEVKKALDSGELTGEALVFDNTVQSLNALKTSWLKPLKETWLKKLLLPQNVG